MRPMVKAFWGAVSAVIVVALLVGVFSGLGKTGGGEVAVVRNGGWFDDNQIRQVVQPGSGLIWVGMWSSMHRYPAQQRFYTMTADPQRGGRPGIDLAHAPSGDGVEMGIEATIYFRLNTDPATMRHFDELYGTRQFRTSDDGALLYAWDGVDGWNAFFDATVRPIIENGLRIQLNQVTCAELVSSCALVQNGAGGGPAGGPIVQTPGQNNTNIAKIEQAIDDNLPQDLAKNLGGNFLQDIKFNLVRVTLPAPVQDAVTKAQAAFAAISEAQGYDACPACAQIDMIKALPPGVTTYAPGAGVAVGGK
jgi:regulator of protease activity HflC (stomatin/prohibitin superfamily)